MTKDFDPTVLDKRPKPDGGPAFPIQCHLGDHHHGLSLRDYFAGQALLRVHDEGGRYGPDGVKQVAKYSYAMADAMIAERAK